MILYGYRITEDKHNVTFTNEHGITKIDKSIFDQQKLKLFKIINYSIGIIDLSQAETDELIIACGYDKQLINTAIKYCLVVLFDINYRHKHFDNIDEFNEKTEKYQIKECITQKFKNRFNIEGEKKAIIKPGISSASTSPNSKSSSALHTPRKPAEKIESANETPRKSDSS